MARLDQFLPALRGVLERQAVPAPGRLQDLLESAAAFNPSLGGGVSAVLRPELAMATLVAIAPVFIVFLFAQRALVTGMLTGAAKG